MTEQSDWVPSEVDTSKPNMARSYDYWLGGSHNFAVDREYARGILKALPNTRRIAQDNRAFMQRVVRYMMSQGIRQFLDLGSGIPTVGNVHEVAHQIDPATRVVYVDIDPIAVTHSEQILANVDHCFALQEDLRNVDAILGNERVQSVLDFDSPMAMLYVSVLHVVSDDDDPAGIIARYGERMASGSYMAITHGTADAFETEMRAAQDLSKRTATPGHLRNKEQVRALFGEFELVEPGLVWASEWRPDEPADIAAESEVKGFYAGVGRKP